MQAVVSCTSRHWPKLRILPCFAIACSRAAMFRNDTVCTCVATLPVHSLVLCNRLGSITAISAGTTLASTRSVATYLISQLPRCATVCNVIKLLVNHALVVLQSTRSTPVLQQIHWGSGRGQPGGVKPGSSLSGRASLLFRMLEGTWSAPADAVLLQLSEACFLDPTAVRAVLLVPNHGMPFHHDYFLQSLCFIPCMGISAP